MFDAFNKKGVRRILTSAKSDRASESNEDATTSMIFTPLKFMSPQDVLACLGAFLPNTALPDVAEIQTVDVELWPAGLTAHSPAGQSRVEPDLVVTLNAKAKRFVVVGELKWDWMPSRAALEEQIERQRHALRRREGNRRGQILMFAIVKSKRSYYGLDGVEIVDWWAFHRRTQSFCLKRTKNGVAYRWAADVCDFLQRAEKAVFNGFSPAGIAGDVPVFFAGNGRAKKV